MPANLVKLGADVQRAALAVQVVDGNPLTELAGVAGKVRGALTLLSEAEEGIALEIGLKLMAEERGPTP